MASKAAGGCSNSPINRSKYVVFACLVLFLLLCRLAEAGHHNHGSGSQMEKLLAAGLIAKALAKNGEEGGGGGGGGHHYMPIHIPYHSGGGAAPQHHHHVHHKYVPIPVKHHTNFIIAHHKVPVPVHIPVPVVKTKIVHVPLEKTKIVPIIVHKGHKHSSHSSSAYSSPYDSSSSPYSSPSLSRLTLKKANTQASSASSGIAALTSKDGSRQLRITTLGTVRKVKDGAKNGTSNIQVRRPSSRVPDKWIVVVKNKKRPTTTIRRFTAYDSMVADSNVIPRIAIANNTVMSPSGPR